MFVSSDTAEVISVPTPHALDNVEAKIARIREHTGGGKPTDETRKILGELETERGTWQRTAGEETIGRWLHAHHQHLVHRALAADHDATLKRMAPEYVAAVRREQARYDEELAQD
jgi:hypothetical protein